MRRQILAPALLVLFLITAAPARAETPARDSLYRVLIATPAESLSMNGQRALLREWHRKSEEKNEEEQKKEHKILFLAGAFLALGVLGAVLVHR